MDRWQLSVDPFTRNMKGQVENSCVVCTEYSFQINIISHVNLFKIDKVIYIKLLTSSLLPKNVGAFKVVIQNFK